MMGRDEGMMESNTETEEKQDFAPKGKGEGQRQEEKPEPEEETLRDQTLPWQAPVRWFGMNPLLQGLGWAGHISQG